jgi:hypothetical protein
VCLSRAECIVDCSSGWQVRHVLRLSVGKCSTYLPFARKVSFVRIEFRVGVVSQNALRIELNVTAGGVCNMRCARWVCIDMASRSNLTASSHAALQATQLNTYKHDTWNPKHTTTAERLCCCAAGAHKWKMAPLLEAKVSGRVAPPRRKRVQVERKRNAQHLRCTESLPGQTAQLPICKGSCPSLRTCMNRDTLNPQLIIA